jgi:hypothetical protein
MYMNLPQRHGDTEKITIPNLSWFALSSVPLWRSGDSSDSNRLP